MTFFDDKKHWLSISNLSLKNITMKGRQCSDWMHAFVLAIKNSKTLMFSRITKKGRSFVIILDFLQFVFWKNNLWTLFVLHRPTKSHAICLWHTDSNHFSRPDTLLKEQTNFSCIRQKRVRWNIFPTVL